jgi:hypothetical protein
MCVWNSSLNVQPFVDMAVKKQIHDKCYVGKPHESLKIPSPKGSPN